MSFLAAIAFTTPALRQTLVIVLNGLVLRTFSTIYCAVSVLPTEHPAGLISLHRSHLPMIYLRLIVANVWISLWPLIPIFIRNKRALAHPLRRDIAGDGPASSQCLQSVVPDEADGQNGA